MAAIDEITLRRIAPCQNATITFDAFPGQRLHGQVREVPLQGELQGGVMVYEVPIALTNTQRLPLLVGMTANVQIQVAQAADALLIPAIAIQRRNGQPHVLVRNPADPHLTPIAVPVELGLSDGLYAQALSGLQPGDQIVIEIEAAQTTSTTVSRSIQNPLTNLLRQFTRPIGR